MTLLIHGDKYRQFGWTDIKSKFYQITACLMILMPNIYACVVAGDLISPRMRVLYIMVSVAFFLIPALFFRARTFLFIQSVLLFLAPIEFSHLFINHATTSILYVHAILQSEAGECIEVVETVWPLIVLCLGYIALFYYIVIKYVENNFLFVRHIRIGIGVAMIVLFTLIWLPQILSPRFKTPQEYLQHWQLDMTPVQTKVFPINIYYALGYIAVSNCQIQHEQERLADFTFHITPQKDIAEEIYVLVIGETARYSNFGINGYERNTTPLLAQRSNLISFDSIYSVANLTAVALPFLITRATPQHAQLRYVEKSLVEAFKEAGFYTAWIANQSYGNKYLRRVATSCDYHYYLPINLTKHGNYDINLLNYMVPILENATPKKMIVLHSLGCHFKYNFRYPESFARFQPAFTGDFNVNQMNIENRRLILNTYDNAICYTDFFLDNTIAALAETGKPAVLLYVADHGENLFDDERQLVLHGTYSGSQWEYHVPLMVWMSDAYRRLHPEKAVAMEQNRSKQQSSMVVFHSLLDLADINYANLDTTLCIARPSLVVDSVIDGVDANWKLKKIHELGQRPIGYDDNQPIY